ncbi:MAG: hypothetical protein ACXQS8_06060 [Candidatus Helarchaeales archaeon]
MSKVKKNKSLENKANQQGSMDKDKRIRKLEEELRNLKEKSRKIEKNLKKNIEKLQESLKTKNTMESEYKDRIKSLEMELKGHKSHASSLQKTISGLMNKLEKERENSKEIQQSLEKKVHEYREVEIPRLTREIQELKDQIELQKVAFSEKIMENITSSMLEINMTVKELRNEIKAKEEMIEDLREEISKLKDVRSKLEVKEQKLELLEEKLKTLPKYEKIIKEKDELINKLKLSLAEHGMSDLKLAMQEDRIKELENLVEKQKRMLNSYQKKFPQKVDALKLTAADFELLPCFSITINEKILPIKELPPMKVSKEIKVKEHPKMTSANKVKKSGSLKMERINPRNLKNAGFPNMEQLKMESIPTVSMSPQPVLQRISPKDIPSLRSNSSSKGEPEKEMNLETLGIPGLDEPSPPPRITELKKTPKLERIRPQTINSLTSILEDDGASEQDGSGPPKISKAKKATKRKKKSKKINTSIKIEKHPKIETK